LPAYNEAPALPRLLAELHALHLPADIIVVDDASTDDTGNIARAHGAAVVRHEVNSGAGTSVKDGIRAAQTDIVIMLDADGTYPTAAIPDVIAKLQEGFHMVVGARRGPEYNGQLPKRFARFVFGLLAQFATGKHVPDVNSGMRAFRKSEITPYFPSICNSFSFPTTLTLIYFLTGKRVAYIPIPYAKRIGQSKVRIVRDSLRTLGYMAGVMMRFSPFRLVLLIVFFVFIIGIIAIVFLG